MILKTLAPWKESYEKSRQCIKKKRHHFANKSPYSQSYGFSNSHVWMWELDHKRRLSAEELMLLNCGAREDSWRISWTAKRSNQSILKEINPECSLEGLILKLKLQYFGRLMQRADLLEKTLVLGKTEGKIRREQQRMRLLDSITNLIDMNLSKLWEIVEDRGAWCVIVHEVAKSQTWFSNWSTYHLLYLSHIWETPVLIHFYIFP